MADEDFNPFELGAKRPGEGGEFDPFKQGAKPDKPDATVDNMHGHIKTWLESFVEHSKAGQTQFESGVKERDVGKAALGLGRVVAAPVTGLYGDFDAMEAASRKGINESFSSRVPGEPLGNPVGQGSVIDLAGRAINYATLPITAPVRSVFSGPVANTMNAMVPEGQPKAEPEQIEAAIGLAGPLHGGPGGLVKGASPLALLKPVKPPKPPVNAGMRAAQAEADEFRVKLSRGQASGDLSDIRFEDMASREAHGKPAQDIAAPFFAEQKADIQAAGKGLAADLAGPATVADTPNIAAGSLNAELGDAAARARAGVATAEGAAQQAEAATRAASQADAQRIADTARRNFQPIESVQEAGDTIGSGVRARAAEERAAFKQRYAEIDSMRGEFQGDAFHRVGDRLRNTLDNHADPVVIDTATTPNAHGAVTDLNNYQRLQTRLADPNDPNSIIPVDLQDVYQARKRLVTYYKRAKNSSDGRLTEDLRATGRVLDEFDRHIEAAYSNGLFSGDERAVTAMKEANAQYRQYAQNYRPQFAGDAVGTAMRRIVDRGATPQEIGRMMINSGGDSVRIAQRIEGILGRNSEAYVAIRQGMFADTRVLNKAGEFDALATANKIEKMARSDLAHEVFNVPETDAMLAHARGLRTLEQTIADLPAVRGAEAARETYRAVFGGEDIGGAPGQVFRRIMDGSATPEETMNVLFNALGNGSRPGDVSRAIDAIKAIAGPDSAPISMMRQGAWQKLSSMPEGMTQPQAQKIVTQVSDFLHGRGKTVAESLYDAAERSKMDRFLNVLRRTIIPPGAATRSDTAVASLAAARKYGTEIATTIGGAIGSIGGPYTAGAGALIGSQLKGTVAKVIDGRLAKKTAQHFDWASPRRPTRPRP